VAVAVIRKHYGLTDAEPLDGDTSLAVLERRSSDPHSQHKLVEALADALGLTLTDEQYDRAMRCRPRRPTVRGLVRYFAGLAGGRVLLAAKK
jgi:hypothetical protein